MRERYLADGALVVLADHSHLVDAAEAHRLVVALPHPDELRLLSTKHALRWHSVEIIIITTQIYHIHQHNPEGNHSFLMLLLT